LPGLRLGVRPAIGSNDVCHYHALKVYVEEQHQTPCGGADWPDVGGLRTENVFFPSAVGGGDGTLLSKRGAPLVS
jgi:hypothetical protein